MLATLRLSWLGLLDVFAGLIASHPAAMFDAIHKRRMDRDFEAALALMSSHLRDDIGLPPVPPQEPTTITGARGAVGRHRGTGS
jgi:hypothetical protein